jgi:2-desacetyl-2-hydroxyethyl bacteriochlorophyllide A dehydrogenase
VVSVREVEDRAPAPGQVQIRTKVSVISPGTETWALQNVFTWQPTVYPCVPGYQRVGTITALGEGVTDWAVGELVAGTWGDGHGEVGSMWGAHAALANTATSEIFRLPEGVDPVDAAGLVVAQVGYNAAARVQLADEDWVVVYGDGIIGQCAAQATRARGCRVVLVGHRDDRLALATAQGIEVVVNRRHLPVVATIRERIGQESVTAVLDSVQGEGPQSEFVDLLRHGEGQIVYCRFSSENVWANMAVLQQRELTTHYVSGWTRARLEATLALMAARQMNVRDLITHRVTFCEAPAMYAMIQRKSEPFLGIALDWDA